jgi:hypothetical protein
LGLLAFLVAVGAGVVYLNSRPGTLFIASEPATNVQILLDNKRQPVDGTPATLKLEPGSYVLTVQREGYVPYNEQLEIKPGDNQRRSISLEPLASGTGFTLVTEPAGAQALLDGHTLDGVTPLKVQSVMPGRHKIEVRSPSGSWTQEVDIDAGKMIDLHATLVAATPPQTTVDKARPSADKARPSVAGENRSAPAAAAKPALKTVAKIDDRARGKKAPLLELPDEKAKAQAKAPDKSPAPADKPAAAAVPSGDGWLRLGSKPWTNIVVDGKETGLHTPQTHLKLAAGGHRITLTNAQFNIKETFSVEIKPGETETVIKDLRQQGGDDSD